MIRLNLRRNALPRLLMPLVGGALLLTLMHSAPHAAEISVAKSHSYVMSADDGYGITECITSGGACARVVADAWCEAHGHAAALSFGSAEDVTASTDPMVPAKLRIEPGSYIVTCAD